MTNIPFPAHSHLASYINDASDQWRKQLSNYPNATFIKLGDSYRGIEFNDLNNEFTQLRGLVDDLAVALEYYANDENYNQDNIDVINSYSAKQALTRYHALVKGGV